MDKYQNITKSQFLSEFPSSEMWRFFVDGVKQKNGWKAFENNEPGYLQGMFSAFFNEMVDEAPLSAQTLLRIHAMAVEGVKETNYEEDIEKAKIFRGEDEIVGFKLHLGKNLSKEGYHELINSAKQHGLYAIEEVVVEREAGPLKTFQLVCKPGLVETNINNILDNYKNEMLEAKDNEDKKVEAIVNMVSQLERLHPFNDANCRTFCMLLLQKEFLNIGLMPPILDDPNQFEGFSLKEMCNKAREGCERAQQVFEGRAIETPYRMGVLILDDKQMLPQEASDLTLINQYELVDYPYEKSLDEPTGKHEDQLVQDVIFYEAFDKIFNNIQANKVFTEAQKQQLAPFKKKFEAQREDLANRLSKGMGIATQQFTEMIQYGCSNQVRQLLQSPALQLEERQYTFDEEYYRSLMTGLFTAKEMNRNEISAELEGILISELIALYHKGDKDTASNILGLVYQQDKEYCGKLVVTVTQDPRLALDDKKPEDMVHAAMAIQAHSNYKAAVEAEQKTQSKSWSPLSFYRRKRFEMSGDLKDATTMRDNMLEAVVRGDSKKIEALTYNIQARAANLPQTKSNSFLIHYKNVEKEMHAKPQKTKPTK